MEKFEQIIREHPFFAGLPAESISLIAGCTKNHRFEAGQYLFREGQPADEFFVIRLGRVALEIAAPGKSPVVFTTLGEGEIVGASWLVAPYRWTFDARALEMTRAFGIDAACLRGKCDADPRFGYEMMNRFVPVLVKQLQATQLQILDVYGAP